MINNSHCVLESYDSQTVRCAQLLWQYLAAPAQTVASYAIVVCCSYDLRVCDVACDMLLSGLSDQLVLSGNTGHWTKHLWGEPEAMVFEKRALANGVAKSKIILESKAGNFGENVQLAKQLLPDVSSVTFISKLNSLLRLQLTVAAQWPQEY